MKKVKRKFKQTNGWIEENSVEMRVFKWFTGGKSQ